MPPLPPPRRPFRAGPPRPGEKRRAILHKVADLIEARADEIAAMECLDTGQCWRFMSKAALRGAENFRFFADRAPGAADGQALPTADHLNYTTRKPIGPVAVITPWNTPFMLSTWKIAPALGCRLHRGAQARRMVALFGPPAGRDRAAGWRSGGRVEFPQRAG